MRLEGLLHVQGGGLEVDLDRRRAVVRQLERARHVVRHGVDLDDLVPRRRPRRATTRPRSPSPRSRCRRGAAPTTRRATWPRPRRRRRAARGPSLQLHRAVVRRSTRPPPSSRRWRRRPCRRRSRQRRARGTWSRSRGPPACGASRSLESPTAPCSGWPSASRTRRCAGPCRRPSGRRRGPGSRPARRSPRSAHVERARRAARARKRRGGCRVRGEVRRRRVLDDEGRDLGLAVGGPERQPPLHAQLVRGARHALDRRALGRRRPSRVGLEVDRRRRVAVARRVAGGDADAEGVRDARVLEEVLDRVAVRRARLDVQGHGRRVVGREVAVLEEVRAAARRGRRVPWQTTGCNEAPRPKARRQRRRRVVAFSDTRALPAVACVRGEGDAVVHVVVLREGLLDGHVAHVVEEPSALLNEQFTGGSGRGGRVEARVHGERPGVLRALRLDLQSNCFGTFARVRAGRGAWSSSRTRCSVSSCRPSAR